jgi:suppressor for copper-sensitivity B
MLILLLKFFIEQPTNILFKCSALAIVLICLFTMPSQMNQHELEEDRALSEIWHKFDINEIEHQLNQNKIVLVDITASWCATCQINKLLVLDTDFFTRIAKAKNIYAMRADVSRSIDPQVKRFMSMHSAHAIPLNVVYAPTMRKGIKLDTFLTPAHLSNTISSFK